MARRIDVRLYGALLGLLVLAVSSVGPEPPGRLNAQDRPSRAMVLTGQNNHGWQVLSAHYRSILEETGLFEVDVVTSPARGRRHERVRPRVSRTTT